MPYRSSRDMSGSDFFIIFIFFGIMLIIGYVSARQDKKRKKAIEDYCHRANIGYEKYLSSLPYEVKGFKITTKGYSQSYTSVMSGKRFGIEFHVMDFYYNVGGKNGGRNCTMCLFSKKGLRLPHFYAREENAVIDGLGQFFGGQDIDYDQDPDFSGSYVLQGENETQVREYFNAEIRRAFTRMAEFGYEYEGGGDYFMVVDNIGFKDIYERMRFLGNSIMIYAVLLFDRRRN